MDKKRKITWISKEPYQLMVFVDNEENLAFTCDGMGKH